MKLSIIIVNYKTKGLLKQCLRGILAAHLPFDHEIIVVDNNSGDGSVEMVRETFPTVKLIASARNVGCGAGNNLGVKRAQGEYLLIMNSDVALFDHAVKKLLDYLDEHSRVGIAVPRLINPDGTTQLSTFLFPRFLVPLFRRTPLGKFPPAKRILRRYLMSEWDHHETRPVGWALGACLLIRASAMRDVGGFDERYFVYVEDTDLCRRMWAVGWEVHFVHAAEMVHYHKRESAESPGLGAIFAYPTRVHIRSWLTYFRKYHRQPTPPHSL